MTKRAKGFWEPRLSASITVVRLISLYLLPGEYYNRRKSDLTRYGTLVSDTPATEAKESGVEGETCHFKFEACCASHPQFTPGASTALTWTNLFNYQLMVGGLVRGNLNRHRSSAGYASNLSD